MPIVNKIPAKIGPTIRTNNYIRKRRVAAYARVSTDSDEQYTSYAAQVDYYTQYIKNHIDWEFVKVYSDEGVSGLRTKNRVGFNEMISDAVAGKIDLIITKSISRLGRNTVDTLTAIRKLQESGVEVWFEKENVYTSDSKCELVITIMSSMAQEESRNISENVTWGKRKAFADGKVYLPYSHFLGYKRGKDDLPEIVPEEAEVVKRIYDMFLYGKTPGAIARQLTAEGIKTPGGKEKWQSNVVFSILTNEKYKGEAILQKNFTLNYLTKTRKKNEGELPQYYVKDSHPAIITPEVFDRVQREVARRKEIGKKYSGASIFSSRIICGECGDFYGAKVWDSTNKNRRTVWQCNSKFKGESICSTRHLTEEQIKKSFLTAYNSVLHNKKALLEDLDLIRETLYDVTNVCSHLTTQGSRVYFTNSSDCCSIFEKLDFSRSPTIWGGTLKIRAISFIWNLRVSRNCASFGEMEMGVYFIPSSSTAILFALPLPPNVFCQESRTL